MTIKQLQEKATAGELCLIERVTRAQHEAVLDRVLTKFELNVRKMLHPSMQRDMQSIHEAIITAVQATRIELQNLES